MALLDRDSAVKTATVTVGPAHHFDPRPPPRSTPTAGAADNLTITAKDASGEHGHHLHRLPQPHLLWGASTSPDGTAPTVVGLAPARNVAFGSPTAINFTAGVATVSPRPKTGR